MTNQTTILTVRNYTNHTVQDLPAQWTESEDAIFVDTERLMRDTSAEDDIIYRVQDQKFYIDRITAEKTFLKPFIEPASEFEGMSVDEIMTKLTNK